MVRGRSVSFVQDSFHTNGYKCCCVNTILPLKITALGLCLGVCIETCMRRAERIMVVLAYVTAISNGQNLKHLWVCHGDIEDL